MEGEEDRIVDSTEIKAQIEQENKGNAKALLPIAVFLLFFLGSGVIAKDFYAMPTIVAFLIALAVAFCQNPRLKFNDKIKVCTKGIGDENVVMMCFIFLTAGAFSGAVTAAGGADSTVYLGLSLIPSQFAVVGLFLIGCFISISMGTSVGTIVALAPIAVGVSNATSFAMPLCLSAVVSGAMFGDNLSMISDTTIAAVRTQGCEMSDKFKMNFKIVLPAAIPGILSGIILSIGRIVGETAALIYTAGTVTGVAGLMDSGRTLAIHMYVLSNEGLHKNEANATAVVLLVIVLLINGVSSLIAKRFEAVKE